MSSADFSLRPFAVGSLMGVRSFRVTPEGVLTGVSAREAWKPGINEAICRRPEVGFAASIAALRQAAASSAMSLWGLQNAMCALSGRVNLTKRPKPKPPKPAPPVVEQPPHQAGTLHCTCGFYAYFDEGNNPHHGPSQALGIIEGFGVCTTGTRGFRSSKARLRALVFDEEFTRHSGLLLPAIGEHYPDVPAFGSLKAALAEFPLTPVEGARKPEHPVVQVGLIGRNVTYTMHVDTREFDRALRVVLRAYEPKPKAARDETPRDRALRLRRERNTGPADVRGLDGRRRA